MSETMAWQDLIHAVHRLESNLASYEDGYKKGRKDEREHAKTLRDPDRLAEIQHLQEALRKKNEKHRQLRAQYKRLKDAKRPRARAYICRQLALTPSPHWVWVVHIRAGARHGDEYRSPTYAQALQWALARLEEEIGEKQS